MPDRVSSKIGVSDSVKLGTKFRSISQNPWLSLPALFLADDTSAHSAVGQDIKEQNRPLIFEQGNISTVPLLFCQAVRNTANGAVRRKVQLWKVLPDKPSGREVTVHMERGKRVKFELTLARPPFIMHSGSLCVYVCQLPLARHDGGQGPSTSPKETARLGTQDLLLHMGHRNSYDGPSEQLKHRNDRDDGTSWPSKGLRRTTVPAGDPDRKSIKQQSMAVDGKLIRAYGIRGGLDTASRVKTFVTLPGPSSRHEAVSRSSKNSAARESWRTLDNRSEAHKRRGGGGGGLR
ncbi:hypothetical protein BD410DRAFT_799946 [Rickenella mellea]|uniref:Uncharacterized protein n=1 Tax=Rickenella mellea TaxID=50990 RepID=A0A4Y7QGP3_9AGAM|nr:hypothetical protein BD410DRAFT_799946 [Rickenella mellea]